MLFLVLALASCGEADPPAGGDTTRLTAGEPTFCEGGRDVGPCCCPRTEDPTTSSSIVAVGGFTTDGTCKVIADIPADQYLSGEDADGCPIWYLEDPPVGGLPEPAR